MASSTPIIVSDLSSMREIVDDEGALFVKAGDADSFQKNIEWAFAHPDDMRARAQAARDEVQKFTWERRASGIVDFMKGLLYS